MKLQKVEKLGKRVISSIKIYTRPFTSVILFDVSFWENFAYVLNEWLQIVFQETAFTTGV